MLRDCAAPRLATHSERALRHLPRILAALSARTCEAQNTGAAFSRDGCGYDGARGARRYGRVLAPARCACRRLRTRVDRPLLRRKKQAGDLHASILVARFRLPHGLRLADRPARLRTYQGRRGPTLTGR